MNDFSLSQFIKQELSGWKRIEVIWLGIFLAMQVGVYAYQPDSLLAMIAGVSGLVCVVLVSKGKVSNYFFGLIFAYTYFYASWQNNYIGEMNSVLYVYLPAQFIGFFIWQANMQKDQQGGTAVKVRALSPKGWGILLATLAVCSFLFIQILNAAGGSSTTLDGTTTIITFAAQLLMILRFREQWVLWIALNILSIALWWQTPSILVMYVGYLLNSLYGLYNWTKLQKQAQI